jgi:hypothetical protein
MNYIPDSLYASLNPEQLPFCSNQLDTELGPVYAPERANGIKCPFGTIESASRGIFFEEPAFPDTIFGRVPQLTPRSLNKIGMEWRN